MDNTNQPNTPRFNLHFTDETKPKAHTSGYNSRPQGHGGEEIKGKLPDDRKAAIAHLFNVREQQKGANGKVVQTYNELTGKMGPKWVFFDGVTHEVPAVILYLNYAINNLWALAEMPSTESENVDKLMKTLNGDEKLFGKIADFLWTFKFDEPQRDFSACPADAKDKPLCDWKANAEKIIRKIFDLRNFFIHSNEAGIAPVETDETLYRFLEGVLGAEARAAAGEDPAFKTDKVNKLKIVNKFGRDANRCYQFTRKGIIFLICLALYKDEAEQFCSLMHDLKLPSDTSKDELAKIKCSSVDEFVHFLPSGKKKAMRAFFTHFSYRRGRKSLDAENQDHIMFADLVTHLNKVPEPAYEYLALADERGRLETLAAASTESDENKRDKYTLKKRDRVKFSQYVAAFLEDFDVLPSIHFKRFDTTPSTGRRKYLFGKENDNAVQDGDHRRTDRHFSVYDGAVRFEWRVPESQHYGAIKINSLRSSLAESDLPKIVLAYKSAKGAMNGWLDRYFTAYHRILERMVNTGDINSFSIDDESYLADFAAVSGKTPDEIKADFNGSLKAFFPMQLLRYFTKESGVLSKAEKAAACRAEIERVKAKASEFITRLQVRDEIRALAIDKRPCAATRLRELSLKYPPNTLKFSDGDFVHQVFTLFNLYLTPDNRFRQLSLGEQHNRGIKDHEYQLLHAIIGKFALDPQALTKFIEKDPNSDRADMLRAVVKMITSNARMFAAERDKLLPRSKRPPRPSPRLQDLALAATEIIVSTCDDYLNDSDLDSSVDYWYGPIMGVRNGAERSVDNLRRVILGIDHARWSRAYDYANHKPFSNRDLAATAHVVSQVELPGGVIDRFFIEGAGARAFKDFVKDGRFNAGAAVRSRLGGAVKLRGYYDIAPLVNALKMLKQNPAAGLSSVQGLKTTYFINAAKFGEEPRMVEVKADVSRPALKAAAAAIAKFRVQDQTLLFLACEYQARAGIANAKGGEDVYGYFTEMVPFKGVLARRNDLLRPVFDTIVTKKDEIAKIEGVSPDENGNYDFYALQKVYQETRSRDFGVRRELMPLLAKFEGLVLIQREEYKRASDAAKAAKTSASEAIRRMEHGYYRKLFPALTFEEYNAIVEVRNLVCHQDNFNLVGNPTIAKAKVLLKKYNC